MSKNEMPQADIVERLRGYPVGPADMMALFKEAAAEIERLRERLEMTHAWRMIDGKMAKIAVEPGSIPDGIECRDETIRLQDREIERLRRSPPSPSVDPDTLKAARRIVKMTDDGEPLRDLLDELNAWGATIARALLAASPSPWRDMESAPKGGRWVSLWWPYVTDAPFSGYCVNGKWHAAPSGETWPTGPTAWQPLPEPPSEGEK